MTTKKQTTSLFTTYGRSMGADAAVQGVSKTELATLLMEKHDSREKFSEWAEYEEFVRAFVAGYMHRQTGKEPSAAWVQKTWENKRSKEAKEAKTWDAFNSANTVFLGILARAFPLEKKKSGARQNPGEEKDGPVVTITPLEIMQGVFGEELADLLKWVSDHEEVQAKVAEAIKAIKAESEKPATKRRMKL